MLPTRTDSILKFIVTQYIAGATPVPSQLITRECELGVSSATVRNEMAYLEQEGYIIRPHTSAGAVPSDKGYRNYVDSLRDVKLPPAEQRLVSHLFHQVERRLEEWLSLAAALISRSAQNVVLITMPKPADSRLRHVELISIQDTLTLIILVLHGLGIKKQLMSLTHAVLQPELTAISNRLNAAYSGLTRLEIKDKEVELGEVERQAVDYIVKMIQAEDELEYEEPYLDGWHFMLNQPEFANSQRVLALIELIEQRRLLEVLSVPEPGSAGVKVVIGKENKAEAIRDYSAIITRYGLPREAVGTICILGPTRMPYARAISTIDYLASVLSELILILYGKNPGEPARRRN